MSNKQYVSKCCGAKVRIVGKVTMYHVCAKCHKPCDIVAKEPK